MWLPYDGKSTLTDRLNQLFEWLDLKEDLRPSLLMMYVLNVDMAGHQEGPDSLAVRRLLFFFSHWFSLV